MPQQQQILFQNGINNPSKSTSTPTLRQRNGSFEATRGVDNFRKGGGKKFKKFLNLIKKFYF